MLTRPLNLAILGVTGRMGRALVAAIDEVEGVRLVGAAGSPTSEWARRDVGELVGGPHREVMVHADVDEALSAAQVAIDFSSPEATVRNLEACLAQRCALVLGTTGHDASTDERISQAAERIAVLAAPNMSRGVTLLLKLVELAARTLNEKYDVEIFEAHHRHKKDAPSGTALALGRAAAAARGAKLEELAEYARHGVAHPRAPGSIGFSVFRGGDVVGDHTVSFAGLGERLELTHRASDRMAFARGALQAAQWIATRSPGVYSMQDVLGLRDL